MISACNKTDHLWYLYTQVNIGYLLNCFFLPKFNVKTFFVYFFFHYTDFSCTYFMLLSINKSDFFFFVCTIDLAVFYKHMYAINYSSPTLYLYIMLQ